MQYLKEELDIKGGIKKFKNWYNYRDIYNICKKYSIENYHINDDGTIDVNGSVDLRDMGLQKIPLQFGRVSGGFWCSGNNLQDLIGSPRRVGANFDCDRNYNLKSLEGAPTYIGSAFWCQRNENLWSMDSFPRHAKDVFLGETPISVVYNLFMDVYLQDGGEFFKTSWGLMDFFEHCDPVYPGGVIKKRRLENFLSSIERKLILDDIKTLKKGGWKIE